MKKIYFTLVCLLAFNLGYAQSTWPYVVAAGAGITTLNNVTIVSSDLLVVSDNEIYNAVNSFNMSGTSQRLEFNKYSNGSWTNLPDISTNETIARTILRKSKNNNDIYVAYTYQLSNFTDYLKVKKFDGTNWTDVGTVQTWGSINFDFQLDNNDVPILLGKRSGSFQPVKIVKWVSNAWTEIDLTDYLNITFDKGSSYVDANNNLVYFISSQKSSLTETYTRIDIDTLVGTTITNHVEDIRTFANSNVFFLLDSNGNQMFFAQRSPSGTGCRLSLIKNTAGTWAVSKTDTSDFNLVRNVAVDNTGRILFVGVQYNKFTGTMYDFSNLTAPVYSSPVNSEINHMRFTKDKAYAFIRNGVVSADINNLTGINTNKEIAINIYPNPTNNSLNILNIINSDVNKIQVYSITGELMLDEKNTTNINVENFTKGMYILKIELIDGSVGRAKFIKE